MATETSWPFDFQTDGTTPEETTQTDGTVLWRLHAFAQHGAQDGVADIGFYGTLAAGVAFDGAARAGSVPASLACTVNAGARTVNIADGYALARGTAYKLTGGDKTLTFTANSSGSDRYDRVMLKHEPAAWKTTLVVKAGTAGAGIPPTATQTDGGVWEIPLWTVKIRNAVGALSASDIQPDERLFLTYWPQHHLNGASDSHPNTSDVWTSMVAAAATQFYVPHSGRVLVSIGGRNAAAEVNNWLGFLIRRGDSNGAIIVSESLPQAIKFRSGGSQGPSGSAGPFLITGLDEGLHYAVTRQRTNATGTWDDVYLTVQPA